MYTLELAPAYMAGADAAGTASTGAMHSTAGIGTAYTAGAGANCSLSEREHLHIRVDLRVIETIGSDMLRFSLKYDSVVFAAGSTGVQTSVVVVQAGHLLAPTRTVSDGILRDTCV